MKATEYNKQMKYLPDFMKDFHDQKDLFKAMEQLYKDDEQYKKAGYNWVDNHIFIVDFFLWFMGLHGYKLQKIRQSDIEFFDIRSTMDHYIKQRQDQCAALLTEVSKEQTT